MGVMDKVMLSFNEPWWPQDVTWLGFLWKGADLAKVDKEDYWTTRIFAVSHPLGSGNVLTLWTSGEVAKLVSISTNAKLILSVCLLLFGC